MDIAFKGGEALQAALKDIQKKAEAVGSLRVGFMEGATYSDGTPVAYIASIQEFGAVVDVDAHQQTVYRKIKADGSFAKNGKFVKMTQSNFSTSHQVEAHQINIPARPFFRTMISQKSPGWGARIARLAKDNKYKMATVWQLMGDGIKGQLQESIRDWSAPANSASTIAKKGFNDPLIASGHMVDSVDFEVGK